MPAPHPPSAELFVREEGNGPAVVLVHGLGGDHAIWNLVRSDLASEYRTLSPDLRGHGRTPAPEGSTFSFPEMEGDLLRMMEEHRLTTAHLVGVSGGGFLALQMALDHPGRVSTLTVFSAGAYCDHHTREIAESWAEAYRAGGSEGLLLRLVKDLFYPDWVEGHMEYIDRLRDQLREPEVRVAAAWAQAIGAFDLRGRLARIRAPTMIVQGMDDIVVDASHGRFLRQSIPGSELRLLRDTGHVVPIERPEETLKAIRDSIARQPATHGSSAPAP